MQETEPLEKQEPAGMPNKTIYVSESDLPVFERAQELAGENLSATIAKALYRLVEAQELAKHGLEEITVTTGTIVHVPKRFIGRSLARAQIGGRSEPQIRTYEIFLTQKGRYALHTKLEPNWEFRDVEWTVPVEYRFEVFETLEEFQDEVPGELYAAAVAAVMSDDGVEFLDI